MLVALINMYANGGSYTHGLLKCISGRIVFSLRRSMRMFFKQNKRKHLHKKRAQFRDTKMAAVPLFRDINMANVTSRENTISRSALCSK